MEEWDRKGFLVGVDEGGDSRGRFHFLVDTLPFPDKDSANISDVCLLNLPESELRRERSTPLKSLKDAGVLISFGGEDPFHLT